MIILARLFSTVVLIALAILFNGEATPVAIGFVLYVIVMIGIGRLRET